MKRWWWFVGSVTGALILTGAGLWWFRHPQDGTPVNSSGGSISLSESAGSGAGPTATPVAASGNADSAAGSGLAVAQANANGQILGSSSNGSGNNSGNSNTATNSNATNTGAKAAPGPSEFGQYDTYKNDQNVYTGDFYAGSGAAAAAGKCVTVNYRGWLTNGQEFDESYARNKPFVFELGKGQVIQGWDYGFNGMQAGGKRRLIVPPAVGYGSQAHGNIPGGSVLVFDVELVGVHDPDTSKPTPCQ